MKLFNSVILLFIFNITFSVAQESEDPFRELEIEKPIIEEKKVSSPTTTKKTETKKSSNIKNPKTYLSAKDYILKGIVLSSKKSFAIISTKDTLDQVITIGEVLGKEGWKVLNIAEESILVGDFSNQKKSTTLYIVD